jgi:hypothetical protein
MNRARRPDIVLVSANIGGIDPVFPLPPHPGIHAVYFTDAAPCEAEATWDRVVRVPHSDNPRMAAKFYKCQIHRLPETRGFPWLMWSDTSARFKDLSFVPGLVQRLGRYGTRAALVPHPNRRSPAEEYQYVIDRITEGNVYLASRYTAEEMRAERDHFAKRHDLRALPLWCGGLWVFANAPRSHAFFNAWWRCVNTWAIIDQPAISPLLVEHGIRPVPIKLPLMDNRYWTRVEHA